MMTTLEEVKMNFYLGYKHHYLPATFETFFEPLEIITEELMMFFVRRELIRTDTPEWGFYFSDGCFVFNRLTGTSYTGADYFGDEKAIQARVEFVTKHIKSGHYP
jgi:hypothetical protein